MTEDRETLAHLLRTRRAKVSPADAGLPPGTGAPPVQKRAPLRSERAGQLMTAVHDRRRLQKGSSAHSSGSHAVQVHRWTPAD